jgi:hypothetical protein
MSGRRRGRTNARVAAGLRPPVGMCRYRELVSELLPNVDALVEALAGESPALQDARALAEAAREAATEVALEAALTQVAATWRRC